MTDPKAVGPREGNDEVPESPTTTPGGVYDVLANEPNETDEEGDTE